MSDVWPRFAVTTMATGLKKNDAFSNMQTRPTCGQNIRQNRKTFFTKWCWRKAFAWLTNFMNKHGNCVYCRKESRDPVLKYGSSCEVRRRQRNIRAIQSVPGNAKTLQASFERHEY